MNSRFHYRLTCICATITLLSACNPGTPQGSIEFNAGGYASSLSDTELNNLPEEQQYQVVNKLMATLFRGISVDDYFDLNAGVENLKPRSNTFLQDLRKQLGTDLPVENRAAIDAAIDGLDAEGNPDANLALYTFDTTTDLKRNNRPRQLPLARIKEYPISHDFYAHWIAYFLANTILFSPAVEMESTDNSDAQRMYRFLVNSVEQRLDVRSVVRANLPSLARWRVSRSAENHALEAYELYLGLFETDEDSVRGGIACRDYFLTSESDDYLIGQTDFPNTQPQLILESQYVTTCNDLYDVIARHELLMPRVTEVIVNYLMSGRTQADRISMIGAIVASGPKTFEDIFTGIIFSRQYLLYTQRPKSFEEMLMNLLDTMHWNVRSSPGSSIGKSVFSNMASNESHPLYLGNKNWDTLSLKIGRLPDVPLDGLSFANYHKSIREYFLLFSENSYEGGHNSMPGLIYQADGTLLPHVAPMTLDEYLDYLFMNAAFRRANAVEKTDLTAIFDANAWLNNNAGVYTLKRGDLYDNVALLVLDYLSRLPEFYYFKSVNGAG